MIHVPKTKSIGYMYRHAISTPYEQLVVDLIVRGAMLIGAGIGAYIVLKMLDKI